MLSGEHMYACDVRNKAFIVLCVHIIDYVYIYMLLGSRCTRQYDEGQYINCCDSAYFCDLYSCVCRV